MKIIAQPMDVLATVSPGAIPRPYRIRYTDRRGNRQDYIIEQILEQQQCSLAGKDAVRYTCQCRRRSIPFLFELKYFIREHRWELYKL